MKFSRWSENGTIQRILEEMQAQGIIGTETDVLCLDSTRIKVHPDAAGAGKKRKAEYQTFKKGLTTKIHVICTSDHCAFVFSLLPGNCHDAPHGIKLIDTIYSEDRHIC